MRIMFQPDALHHQAPSNHTRHHHTLSGPPEKTSGFNIPNAPTASLHAARAAYNHKAAAVGEIIASSIKTRYRIAPIPNTDPLPTSTPAKTIHGRIHAQSDIGLRPTRIQHFLHMPPTQPH